MASRPRWRGTLAIGLVNVPVHLFATSDKKSAAPVGHAVHRKCQTQANSKKWCALCNVEIPEDELMTGYDVPAGHTGPKVHVDKCKEKTSGKECGCPTSAFVELDEKNIEALKVESSKTIHVRQVAPVSELEPLMIADTMFLISDGTAAAAEAEAILIKAMAGKIGIGSIVMNGRERSVAVMVYGEGFLLHLLRTADQMKAFPDRVALPPANPQMVELAKQLVKSMEGPLDLSETRDSYADGLRSLVTEAAGGKGEPVAAVAPQQKVSSLMEALMASVQATPKIDNAKVDKKSASKQSKKAS